MSTTKTFSVQVVAERPFCGCCGAYISGDAEWPWCWRCGKHPDARRIGRLGPEPEYVDRVIDRDCGRCLGCRKPFVVQDVGVKGDIARVYGQRGGWKRYHVGCWPWSFREQGGVRL